MRHFFLLLISGLAMYGVWQLTSPLIRKNATMTIAKHAYRLFIFIGLLLLLLIAAYYTPALHLL